MHIPDGILPLPVTLGGYAVSVGVAWYCIRQINRREDPRAAVPKAALLTAAFFVASLIQIPLPPAGVHLVLGGLLGATLGVFAFPAILVGLFFQAVMFGHGGITTLGINGVILGIPALAAAWLFHFHARRPNPSPMRTGIFGCLAGAASIILSLVFFTGILITNMPAHLDVGAECSALFILLAAHVPLIILEGIMTGFVVAYLRRVKPQLLVGL